MQVNSCANPFIYATILPEFTKLCGGGPSGNRVRKKPKTVSKTVSIPLATPRRSKTTSRLFSTGSKQDATDVAKAFAASLDKTLTK